MLNRKKDKELRKMRKFKAGVSKLWDLMSDNVR